MPDLHRRRNPRPPHAAHPCRKTRRRSVGAVRAFGDRGRQPRREQPVVSLSRPDCRLARNAARGPDALNRWCARAIERPRVPSLENAMPAKRKKRVEPKAIRRSDIDPKRRVKEGPDGLCDPADPGHRWERPLQAPGRMQVDFEERIDFRRLHDYRLARTRNALARSGLGALLVFDQHNIRYVSSTVIGEWARDKLTRWCLLTGNGDPYVWDFGSAARHHKIYAPWLPKNQCLAGLAGLRGAVHPKVGLFEAAAKEIYD